MPRNPKYGLRLSWLDAAISPSIWDVGNKWLYQMCKRHHRHRKLAEVAAKIWLIGRAYAAAAERGVAGKGKGDAYIKKLANRFIEQRADRLLAKLPTRPSTLKNHINLVIEVHHEFEQIFSKRTNLGRVSLASKYLHFHRPDLFPIYDSRAATAIGRVSPDARFVEYDVLPRFQHLKYAKFCQRYCWLSDRIEAEAKRTLNLRQLDTMLLQIYQDTKTRKARKD
jgi:hypothetical protein